jgi:hypothetical protein
LPVNQGANRGKTRRFQGKPVQFGNRLFFFLINALGHKKSPRYDAGAGILLICSPRCLGSGWGLINRNTGVSLSSLQDQVCLSIRAQIGSEAGIFWALPTLMEMVGFLRGNNCKIRENRPRNSRHASCLDEKPRRRLIYSQIIDRLTL